MTFEKLAMSRLNRLPELSPEVWDKQGIDRESGDQRKAPFVGAQAKKAGDVAEFLTKKIDEKYGSLPEALSVAPIRPVRLASLHGVQAGVRADIVAEKIQRIAETDEVEAPSVVSYKGTKYLIDGYHTLTALKLGGIKTIEAAVIKL